MAFRRRCLTREDRCWYDGFEGLGAVAVDDRQPAVGEHPECRVGAAQARPEFRRAELSAARLDMRRRKKELPALRPGRSVNIALLALVCRTNAARVPQTLHVEVLMCNSVRSLRATCHINEHGGPGRSPDPVTCHRRSPPCHSSRAARQKVQIPLGGDANRRQVVRVSARCVPKRYWFCWRRW